MKQPAPHRLDPWPWLFVALFFGCLGGLFLLQPRGYGDPPHWIGYLPLIGCLAFPGLGSFTDRHGSHRKTLALGATLLLPLLALHYLAATAFFSGLWFLFFLLALMLQLLLLSAFPPERHSFLMGAGLLAIFGLGALGLISRPLIYEAPGFLPIIYWVILLAALIFLMLFAASLKEEKPSPKPHPKPDFRGDIGGFFSDESFAGVHGSLLLIWIITVATTSILLFLVSRFQHMPLWYSPDRQAFFSVLACGLGAFFCRGWAARHGSKRGLTLALLLLSLAVLGTFIARTGAAATLSSLALFFFLGATAVAAICLYLSLIPRDRAGLCLGFLFIVCLLGWGAGSLWYRVRQTSPAWLYFYLLPLSAVALQTVKGGRGETRDEESARGIPMGLDWSASEAALPGLAKPRFFSRFSQLLAKVLVEVFYGEIRIRGKEHLRLDGAAIMVANHPNTFLDPLLITAVTPARLFYWTYSAPWKMPIIGSILERMGSTNPTHGSKAWREDCTRKQALQRSIRKLGQSAHMLVFPEGSSEVGLSLKPLKYRAAQLGLAAAKAGGWADDIPIIPLAIDYKEARFIRANVTIHMGQPLWPADYRARFECDPAGGVRELTDRITDHFATSLPHLELEQRERLAEKVRDLYGESATRILGVEGDQEIQDRILESIDEYHRMDPDTLLLFSRRMDAYVSGVARLGTPENHPPISFKQLWRHLTDIFSFASYGLFLNWLPYRLTARLVEWFTDVPVWRAAVKLSFGVMVFTLYYALLGFMVHRLIGPFFAALLLLSLPISALVALGSLDRFAFRFRQLKMLWQAFWTQDTNNDIEAMKMSLMQDLERFRESYAFYKHKAIEPW